MFALFFGFQLLAFIQVNFTYCPELYCYGGKGSLLPASFVWGFSSSSFFIGGGGFFGGTMVPLDQNYSLSLYNTQISRLMAMIIIIIPLNSCSAI